MAAHHDILGFRVVEAGNVEPVWRNVLRQDSVPWIRDYVIRAEVVLPVAAYVAMAGVAIGQLSGSSDYTVRNMTIIGNNALAIRPTGPTELITSLRPAQLTVTVDSEWYDFSIVSNSAAGWAKHCYGQVRSGRASRYAAGVAPLVPRDVPATKWYQTMRRLGLEYGPTFRGLHDIAVGEKVASATVLDVSADSESEYQLHPAAMTLIFQSVIAAAYNGQARAPDKVFQPTYIEELYVGFTTGKKIRVHAEAKEILDDAVVGSVYGVNPTGEPALFLKGITLSALPGDSTQSDSDPHRAVQLEWKPDIDLLDPARTPLKSDREMVSVVTMLEKLFLLCAIENTLQLEYLTTHERYMQKYHDWIKETVEDARAGKSVLGSGAVELCALGSAERQILIQQLMTEASGKDIMAACRVIHAVYSSVVDVFSGWMDAVELLFQDNMLVDFYNFFDWVSYKHLMELLGHGNPNLRILEIGAGTGGTTENVIRHLKDSSGKRLYSKYVYTDISAGFFDKAQMRFSEYPGIDYRMLDITQSPTEQGFEEGSFDLVVAANVRYNERCWFGLKPD